MTHPSPRRLAVAAALLLPLLVLAAPALAAQETTGTPVPTAAATATPADGGTGPGAPGSGLFDLQLDPRAWLGEVWQALLTATLRAIADGIQSVLGVLLSVGDNNNNNIITRTPPGATYAQGTVVQLWRVVQGLANGLLAVITLWNGLNLMVRRHTGEPYHDAAQLLPRLALGALLVNTSLWWGQLLIDLNNAFCAALATAEALPGWNAAGSLADELVAQLARLVYVVVGLLLALQMVMRVALLDILLVVGPLAMLCWALPQAEGWARLWWGTFVATVFTQFVQVVALRLGASMTAELAPGLAAGTPAAGTLAIAASGRDGLAIVIGIATLLLTWKVPGLMRAQLGIGGGGLGFVQYLAYRQGAALVGGAGAGASRRQPVQTCPIGRAA